MQLTDENFNVEMCPTGALYFCDAETNKNGQQLIVTISQTLHACYKKWRNIVVLIKFDLICFSHRIVTCKGNTSYGKKLKIHKKNMKKPYNTDWLLQRRPTKTWYCNSKQQISNIDQRILGFAFWKKLQQPYYSKQWGSTRYPSKKYSSQQQKSPKSKKHSTR